VLVILNPKGEESGSETDPHVTSFLGMTNKSKETGDWYQETGRARAVNPTA